MAPQPYILVVEDNEGDARLVQTIFQDVGEQATVDVRWVQTVSGALDVLDHEPGCTAVLLDLGLPDAQGLEGLAEIRAHAVDVPIVVLSGDDSDTRGLEAVIAGAQDYLVKGSFDAGLLKRALQYAAHRKRAELALVERALHDELTGLPKRSLLLDRLAVAIKRCAREGSVGALLFLDLDQFKHVNDSLGHAVGDAVLKTMSQRLTSAVRGCDTVARIGGDEFVVLLMPLAGMQDALSIAEKLLGALAKPMLANQQQLALSASIGVARFQDETESAEQLMARADLAMYRAKAAGKGRVRAL